MSQNAPTSIRHCPLCGTAMLAGKSEAHLTLADRFECLTCGTVIEVGPPTEHQPAQNAAACPSD